MRSSYSQFKQNIITDAVKNKLTNRQAATALGLTIRQVQNLKRKYMLLSISFSADTCRLHHLHCWRVAIYISVFSHYILIFDTHHLVLDRW